LQKGIEAVIFGPIKQVTQMREQLTSIQDRLKEQEKQCK